jgi:succinylglutamic semialdehyde dehydrogenase
MTGELFIDGTWRAGRGGELVSTDPATGRVLFQAAGGSAQDAVDAVAAARRAGEAWADVPLEARIEIVRRYKTVLQARAEDMARAISEETGKPLWETRTELASMAGKVDISIRAVSERTGEREAATAFGRAVLRHRPHGVMAVLGPFNFPGHLPNGHIVPALLAGDTIVFKPSEETPRVGRLMAQALAEAGVPAGVFNLLQGGREAGAALLSQQIDGLLFTGSAGVGAALAHQFAETPGRILALEMGGNNPLIVWDLAPEALDAAAALIIQSAYLSAGQRCTCARRLIVRDGLEGPLLDRVKALIDRLIVGAPFDEPQPFMGPVIANRAADGLVAGAAALVAKGARVIRPLERPQADRPLLSPALYDITGLAGLPDSELFGPILQLTRVADWDAAIAAANATRFGLSSGLIGGDAALYDRFWAQSRAGVVNWNRPTNGAASNAPFGGIGLSGNHRPSAYYAADYSAWPVASLEADAPEGSIVTGVRP